MKDSINSVNKTLGAGEAGIPAAGQFSKEPTSLVQAIFCEFNPDLIEGEGVKFPLLSVGPQEGALAQTANEAVILEENRRRILSLLREQTKAVLLVFDLSITGVQRVAPFIAQAVKEQGVLTTSVALLPDSIEGNLKDKSLIEGLQALKDKSDAVAMLTNERQSDSFGQLEGQDVPRSTQEVVASMLEALSGILDVKAEVNVDLEDIRIIISGAGTILIGTSKTSGEGRGVRAVEEATECPFLLHKEIHGTSRALVSIMSGDSTELEMDELTEMLDLLQEKAGDEAEIIFGHGNDPELGDSIRVTIIAAGVPEGEVLGG